MHDSGESPDVSICHTVSTMTSSSICQLHDSSVCQSKHDSTWKSINPPVCPLSIPSIQPSAKFAVKIPMSIAVSSFLKVQFMGKFSSVHTSSDLSVDPSGSHHSHCHHQLKTHQNSPNGKLPAQNPSKNTHSPYIICYACHCTHPFIVHSVCLSIRQQTSGIPEEFPSTNYGEKYPAEIMAKNP